MLLTPCLRCCCFSSTGKTTLAHILARQAGYHPFEINASDDRNAAVLESKIRAATEMQAVSFGAAHTAKPNCVIIDEIDGIGDAGEAGAIAMLLRIVQAEAKKVTPGKKGAKDSAQGQEAEGDESGSEDEGATDQQKEEKKSGKQSKRVNANGDPIAKASALKPLRRPIICICNDQFAAALRPLRQVARIFEFTSAPKTKFVDRLKYIASQEGMTYEPRTLAALADVVEMDIRSALNTLQFVHSRGAKLTAATINGLSVGRKDTEKTRFQVWDAVFCDREVKKDNILRFRDMRETEEVNNKSVTSASSTHDTKSRELQSLLADAGDMDKIMEGIFHNYPSVGYSDPSLSKTVECADWLAYADLLDQRISSEVEMGLMAYTPYAAIGIHQLTARPRKVMLEVPQMGYHAFVAHSRNENIVKSFLSPMNRLTQDGLSMTSTVLDVLPYVLDILHPTIRAVNFAMLTSKEKNELSQLIDTMLSLAISYRPEVQSAFTASSAATTWNSRPSADANILYKLDPPIDLLSEWTNPLDAKQTAEKWKQKDRWGNVIEKGGKGAFFKGKFGQPAQQQQQQSTPAFAIEKRDQNMPGKVKQMVLRELEHEAMRRNEARMAEQHQQQTAESKKTVGPDGKELPGSPSLISPAVQKILDEEKRKRARAAASSIASPPSADATGASSSAAAKVDEDDSPASKRAKLSASLNFLNAHADTMKNKQRNRGRPAGAKLQLGGLKTEKEVKTTSKPGIDPSASKVDASGDVEMTPAVSVASSSLPAGASVLSRFTHPLHFKYNEGCTNAVRRTVNVSHFMPL
jgi:DNA polymerase III delta prime subunit